ncbi:MAG TPA: FUSC family protein [Thermoleophilaceae bacterium]
MSTPGRGRFAASRERIPSRDELFEQAAEASRAGLRSRRARLIATARPILQTSVATALAWLVAKELVGHPQPFFAPVAAVITLGLTVGERRRRAVEIVVGVAVGIAIADLLVSVIGTGTWQIAVVTGLAMLGATLVGGGVLLASQAGVSAVLVATLQPPDNGGFEFVRFYDALVGGAVALLVSSLVFPIDPARLVRTSTQPVLDCFANALERIATALESREPKDADAALLAVARVAAAHDGMVDALDGAGEAARLSPRRRGRFAGRLERHAVAAGELGLAIENVRALARGAIRAINLGDAVPADAIEATRQLGRCGTELRRYLEDDDPKPARAAAVRASGLANKVLGETGNLSAVHIVGQIRLAAVDLLRASGLDRDQAQDAVRTASVPAP